jgi:hypothetical protein
MSWVKTRQITREEDMAYSLLSIFDVYIPLIYGKGRENAIRRLREAIARKEKGTLFSFAKIGNTLLLTHIRIKHEDFSIPFSLFTVSNIEHFIAREDKLKEIYKALRDYGSRHTVILYSLEGIGKTQLIITYAKQYKNNYSAIF